MTVASQCRNNCEHVSTAVGGCELRLTEAAGALNGLLDAQNRLPGNRPSLASSWLKRACAKLTANTLPRLLSATKAGKLRAAAPDPNTLRKKRPATMTSDSARSFFGIAAK